jgi:endonuclease/exonuclease/phosphatase family metal-dependent hydrolase
MARHSTATMVVMGDFNTAEYKSDNRAYVEFENTYTNLKNPVKSNALASIDQIFVSKTATVNKTFIEPNKFVVNASDHKPVIVDITTK